MHVRQADPIPRSLMRLKGRAIATYDTAAFLDTRAQDLGGRVAGSAMCGSVYKEHQCLEVAVATLVSLVTLSAVVLLSLGLGYQ